LTTYRIDDKYELKPHLHAGRQVRSEICNYFGGVLMAILEISVVPIGTKGTNLSRYVADCIKVLRNEKKVKYELTAMGTNIEGNLQDLMRIALEMHEVPFKKGAARVVTTLKIDDRRDKKGTLAGKKKAVEKKLRVRLPAGRQGV
jgi:uncharacterized protein (TIGR00106 family)